MLNQMLTGSEQIALVEKTEVFEQHPEVSIDRMESCKFAVLDNEKIVVGPFGQLVRVATDAYAKSYPSKEALLKDLALFRKLQNETENTPQLQAPETILGYFSFDGNIWHLLFNFQYVMYGETNETSYLGGIINPEKYLGKESSSVVDAVSKTIESKLDGASVTMNPALIEKIGDLFYDALSELLSSVSESVKNETAQALLHSAAKHISNAWDICIPYIQGKVNPKHTREISEVGKGIPELGKVIGSMENKKLSEFLMLLSEKIGRDGQVDAGRGRNKLAMELYNASLALYEAAKAIDSAKK